MMLKRKRRRTTAIHLVLLVLALVSALSASGLALAQSTNQYDLSCWGIFTTGGDLRVSTNARVQDAFGHLAVGDMVSLTAIVRQGHVQRFFVNTTSTPDPQPVTGENLIYLSSVWGFLKLIRGCG
jgi:hypothetical protein